MSGPDAPVVEVTGLTKRFGDLVAVDHVDMTVRRGDVLGFLGPNGAGKTTTIRMLLGLIHPDEGEARVFGVDPWRHPVAALRSVSGFVEAPTFYDYLTGRRNLELLAALDGGDAATRIDDVLETVGLTGREGDRVKGYSHGMKQRLGVAATLLRDPEMVILDEPTTGLDPPAMRDMRTLVRRLAEAGRTVLLSSHQMNEVEEICSRVAIIRRGAIIYDGATDDLLQRAARPRVRLSTSDPRRAVELIRGIEEIVVIESAGRDGEVIVDGPTAALDRLTVALGQAGVAIRGFVPERDSLEQAFFRLLDEQQPEPGSPPVSQAAEERQETPA